MAANQHVDPVSRRMAARNGGGCDGSERGRPAKAWVWGLAAAVALLSGCAATSTLLGVSEPEVSAIKVGQPREAVERILGGRLWRLGSAEGRTYDVYQYKASRSSRPVLATALFIGDYFTLGLFEALTWDACRDKEKVEDVKQIGVGYDERDHAVFVSQPWVVHGGGPCRPMRSLVPADSGLPVNAKLAPAGDPYRRLSQPATLELDEKVNVTVDGRDVHGKAVELAPGRHSLSYDAVLKDYIPYEGTFADLEFLPGRLYRLKKERVNCGQLIDIFWVEDADSGEVLVCSQPPSGDSLSAMNDGRQLEELVTPAQAQIAFQRWLRSKDSRSSTYGARAFEESLSPAQLAKLRLLQTGRIRSIQEGLRKVGYTWVPADGQLDACTRAAIRQFQNSSEYTGRVVDGEPSRQLLSDIERSIKKGASANQPVSKPDNCPPLTSGDR